MKFRLLPVALSLFLPAAGQEFAVTLLHNNDVHARVEPTRQRNSTFGGYARLATLVRQERAKAQNTLLLSGGDVFQGTLYFTLYQGLADLAAMNYLRYDAMAVGNHEFDRGPATFAEFVKRAQFPVLAANIDTTAEPLLKDLIKPSTIVQVRGERIGIVGAVTPDLPSISSPGPNVRMLDLVMSVQAEIDRLRSGGVNKILLITHVGYDEEKELAMALKGVDVIVGGHSHSLLGDPGDSNLPRSGSPYPTVLKNADGDTALVVQAWQWGMVLGKLEVVFDGEGDVVRWSGAPIPVSESIAEDSFLASVIAAFRLPLAALSSEVVGEAAVPITNDRGRENLIGNLIADAQLAAAAPSGAVMALMNAGGVRAPIDVGPITFGEAVMVQPFNNTLVLLDLTGDEIKQALEWGVREMPTGSAGMLYVSSGAAYTVDASKPVGSRVTSITLGGAALDGQRTYRVVINSFIAAGGDAHSVLHAAKGQRRELGIEDIDAFVAYLKANKPLSPKLEGRIKILR
jgi:5'-nucleotidase